MPVQHRAVPRVVVIVPARNEAERLGRVLDGVRRVLPEARIGVIDDGSSDGTGEVASARGATALRHPFNLGYGAALQTGYHWALRQPCDRLVQLDADGQHDPESIPALLGALDGGAELVLGSRYLDASTTPRTSMPRRLGSRFFAFVVTRWTGTRITDPTSGFQAMTKRVVERLVLDDFPEDFPDSDVLIALAREGVQLAEVPVRMHERLGGVSMHRGGRIAYYAYKMLLTLSLLPVRRVSPFRAGRAGPS
jgi:glycosyltransferase involved in cell wall biosynthesis